MRVQNILFSLLVSFNLSLNRDLSKLCFSFGYDHYDSMIFTGKT